MAFEKTVQTIVHSLEEGGWKKWLKFALLMGAISFMAYLTFFTDTGFTGLSHEKAIEQAQISREIARGNGFSTKMIRPAALWLFEKNKGSFPVDRQPDIFHAPLNPWVNSWLLLMNTKAWPMTVKDIQYTPDRIIAAGGLIFFLLGVLVNYFTAKRLFDRRLALLGMGLLLLCRRCWDFALSGLPQMLMFFLLGCAVYPLVRAIEARYAERNPTLWLAASGFAFGLLALAHALTLWIFGGALLFVGLFFRSFGRYAGIMLGVFTLVYGPWLLRNYEVCGTPVGLSWYSGMDGTRGTESSLMRSTDISLEDLTPRSFRRKIEVQGRLQLEGLYGLLGSIAVAPIFFVSLLHLFKRPETAVFRWCVLIMWLSASFGMAVFGLMEPKGLHANDLHILFAPLMTFYGLALVLVMWSRLEIAPRPIWIGFLSIIYLVSALPFGEEFLELIGPPKIRVAWPPYVPPYIAILNSWTTEKEIIASDMPWAVAWYADRRSLWLPISIKDFLDLNDYGRLNGRIVGLYLTPISGNKSFISEIVKGEYKEWAQFVMRSVNAKEFPLKYVTALPLDNECVFYSDRDRWTNRED